METWADDSSILFPWGNLLQKGMVRKQIRGLSSGRGLLLREEVICRTFGELMEWSEDKCWPKLRNLSTQSVFPSTYLLNSESEWSGRQKKKKEAELKKQRLVLKKQRLVLKSSWENKPRHQTRCPVGNYMRLHSRGSRHPEVDGALPYKTTVQPQSKFVFGWIKAINSDFLSSKKKKKANCFWGDANIIWNPYVWHSIKYY